MTTHHREGDHDWHSREYVDGWIANDVTRDTQRRPHLRQMVLRAGFDEQAPLRVLDIGSGYGIVTEEVLKAFPNATVTLHDFSEPMATHARQRLAAYADRTTFVSSSLSTPEWTAALDGPFDMAVSALVIHNLNGEGRIPSIYAETQKVLKPGGAFLNYDLVSFTGGLEAHVAWLVEAGFEPVTASPLDEMHAVLIGQVPPERPS